MLTIFTGAHQQRPDHGTVKSADLALMFLSEKLAISLLASRTFREIFLAKWFCLGAMVILLFSL